MSLAHLHLILNHGPVFGIPFGLFFVFWAIILKDDRLSKLALTFILMISAFTGVVFWTGYGAEDLLLQLRGEGIHSSIEPHHVLALYSVVSVAALGILAVPGLVLFQRTYSWRYPILKGYFGLCILASALLSWTANQGGKIVHEEIRSELPFLDLHVSEMSDSAHGNMEHTPEKRANHP